MQYGPALRLHMTSIFSKPSYCHRYCTESPLFLFYGFRSDSLGKIVRLLVTTHLVLTQTANRIRINLGDVVAVSTSLTDVCGATLSIIFFRVLELHSDFCTTVLEIKIPGCIIEMYYLIVVVLSTSIAMTAAI
jgi:hypothetical protein